MYAAHALFVWVLLHFCLLIKSADYPCSLSVAEDIGDGFVRNKKIIFNGIQYDPTNYFTSNGSIWGCTCNIKQCVRKCCPKGFSMLDEKCVSDNGASLTVPVHKDDVFVEHRHLDSFHIIHGSSCKDIGMKLEPSIYPEDQFYLQENGLLYIPIDGVYVTPDNYCIENFLGPNSSSVSVIQCLENNVGENGRTLIKNIFGKR